MPRSTAVISPGLGLYYGQSSLATDRRALIDGVNFRIKYGKLSNQNLGWTRFSSNFTLNGPVVLIDNFFPRSLSEHLLFGTPTDLYRYVPGSPDSVVYLTPRYEVGTASASGTAVTGTGTLWATTGGIKAGDEISFGSAGETDPDATWFVVQSVGGETSITLIASAGTVADGAYTIRRLFTGQVSDNWSFDAFVNDSGSGDDLWLATNGTDDIVSWDGSANQVTLNPQLGFKAGVITVFSNMAIYGDLSVSGVAKPTSIINSDVGSPLLAGDTGVGLSSEFKVHDGTSTVSGRLAIMPLRRLASFTRLSAQTPSTSSTA
jgi:hypothetical protein